MMTWMRQIEEIVSEGYELIGQLRMKRRPDLTCLAGWQQVEEQLIGLVHSRDADPAAIRRLHQCAACFRTMMHDLQFEAGTRPVWNS